MLSRARVLVADDDLELLDAVTDALAHLGAEVVRARSGGELIDKIADEGPFSLVVTDVSMPWMSGLQAMHSARTAGLGTPVIVMTALQDEKVATQVHALGPRAVLLRKPFALDELEAVASKLLASAHPHPEPGPPVGP